MNLERIFMAVAPWVEVQVQVVARELAVEQLHAPQFDDAVTPSAERPVVSVSRTIWRDISGFLGVVDRVLGNLDDQVFLGQDGLARQARLRLQTPRAIQQVFFLFLRCVQRSQPSRTITWQVVQAQLISQACSMLIWLSSKASQMDVPAGP